MLTDTHCHLDFNKFAEDRAAVLQRAVELGVQRILIPALDFESSLSVIKLAESYPNLYAAVGFHPTDLEKFSEQSFAEVKKLANHPKVVAIGEIGLDYYWVKENDAWFGQASIDLLEILSDWHQELSAQNHPLAQKPGVLHSFNGNLETAQEAMSHNFYIGVTGPVTYKNAEEKRRIIKQLPLTQLLIETDAPFLTPVPHRGKRNEPAFVAYIADKIAEIHMTTREQVAKITAENAAHLFGWEG
jgi:TatD DNase family protein